MIDHAVLKPTAGRGDVLAGCELARRLEVASLCVRPCDVAPAARELSGCDVAVGTVIGFPHGTTTTAAKVAEARQAVSDGAEELDMVVNIARLIDGEIDAVRDDIAAVVTAAGGRLVKVILECYYLGRDRMAAGCAATVAAGAQFVKTSTGFADHGATVEDVRFLRGCVGKDFGVKASGGIRSADDALAMIQAGANRIGTSNTEQILNAL